MNNFETRYQKLNEAQRKAVDTIDGPVMVVAGPGSGKTELLSMRAANILRQTDVLPSSILCLTFTDSAAKNMRKRLATIIGDGAYDVAIHTFHSFGAEVIARNPAYFYDGANYKPADELTQIQILEQVFAEMPLDNPLNKKHPTQGYTFMRDLRRLISDLKKGGLDPADFKKVIAGNAQFLEKANTVVSDFVENNTIRSKKSLELVAGLLTALQELEGDSIKEQLVGDLYEAYNEAIDAGSSKPFTEWKKKYVRKDKNGVNVLKDYLDLEKQEAIASAYERYQELLHERGFIDFDDLLLQVVDGFEQKPELKFNYQERYQYVMVDEFQDTSGVQMDLLHLLLDAPVNEGRPNVMVVGDDDQAIYKFQGANLRNILDFHKSYQNPEMIVLTDNYRSTQDILDLIRGIIVKGSERLETTVEGIVKELVSRTEADGMIHDEEFETEIEQLIWIVKEVNKLIDQGRSLGEIAVIGRTHAQLEFISKLFTHYGVSISYERNRDVLKELNVKQLVQILRFVNSLNKANVKQADEYLPEILSYEFWGLDRVDVWKISVESFRERKTWLETMLASEVLSIKKIAQFFIGLAGEKAELTAEQVLDAVLGNRGVKINKEEEYLCPYKEFYFGVGKLDENRLEYLELLQNLKVLVSAVREFEGSRALTLNELVEFVNMHETHNVALNDTTVFATSDDAVHLLTAHKSKGLEFETVFVLSCQDEIWGRNRNMNKLSLPANLPLSADSDEEDDMLRLFYVALSRAKKNLYLSHYKYRLNGRESLKLRFLEGSDSESEKKPPMQVVEKQKAIIEAEDLAVALELDVLDSGEKMSGNEEALLRSVLQDYKLSVTHLTNFLDLEYGGPDIFLERNLLRFPQSLHASAAYGSAMHNALDEFYKAYKSSGSLPNLEELYNFFERSLFGQRMAEADFAKYLEKGKKQLAIYFEEHKDRFDVNDETEMNFAGQGVLVGKAHITGKIDRMKVDKESREIKVIDYKTGKPLKDWKGGYMDRGKTWKYKMQLTFYKLLVEGSREFGAKYMVHDGSLEFLDAGADDAVKVLDLRIELSEVENLKRLIEVVYDRIVNLDFPDTSKYSKDYDGTMEFMDDLLENRA